MNVTITFNAATVQDFEAALVACKSHGFTPSMADAPAVTVRNAKPERHPAVAIFLKRLGKAKYIRLTENRKDGVTDFDDLSARAAAGNQDAVYSIQRAADGFTADDEEIAVAPPTLSEEDAL